MNLMYEMGNRFDMDVLTDGFILLGKALCVFLFCFCFRFDSDDMDGRVAETNKKWREGALQKMQGYILFFFFFSF